MKAAKIFLRKKISDRIHKGHNWVYVNEIGDEVGEYLPGDEVSVFSSSGSFVGKGFISGSSTIRVRMLTRRPEETIDAHLFDSRIRKAIALRERKQADACRIFYADADGISGLIIDKYNDHLLVQCLIPGIDARYSWIEHSLINHYKERMHILKDDSNKLRLFEGLAQGSGPAFHTRIRQHNTLFDINSKEGYSIDRSELRKVIATIAKGQVVWDLCCGNGSLGLTALANGAEETVFIDNNALSLNIVRQHLLANNIHSGAIVLEENVFDFLKHKGSNYPHPGLIIIDPPHFNSTKGSPLSAYKELGLQAIKYLNKGGLLLLGSSSSKVSAQELEHMFLSLSVDSGTMIRIIRKIPQAPDFPVLLTYEYTAYMNYYLLYIEVL